jgi:hypothetical protein
VTLKLKDQVLLSETIAISPGHSFVKTGRTARRSGRARSSRRDQADGRELVAYSPIRLQSEPMPAPVVPPPAPADIKTNEELYLTGLRMEQFHSPTAIPTPTGRRRCGAIPATSA